MFKFIPYLVCECGEEIEFEPVIHPALPKTKKMRASARLIGWQCDSHKHYNGVKGRDLCPTCKEIAEGGEL